MTTEDVVELEGREHGLVYDEHGGVALEPAITRTVAEPRAERGGRPLTPDEFEKLFGDQRRRGVAHLHIRLRP